MAYKRKRRNMKQDILLEGKKRAFMFSYAGRSIGHTVGRSPTSASQLLKLAAMAALRSGEARFSLVGSILSQKFG